MLKSHLLLRKIHRKVTIKITSLDQHLDLQKIAIEKYAQEQELELIMYVEKISTRKKKE